MTSEQLEKIFEETVSKWDGDNAFQGLQILSKYVTNLVTGADHDIMYGPDVANVVKEITEEDAIKLAELNWHIDGDSECFACFV